MTNSITYIQLIIRSFQALQNNFNNQISIIHGTDCMWLIAISSKTTLWLLVLPCICPTVMSSICYYYLPLYWILLLIEVNSFLYLLYSLVCYLAEIIIKYNSFTLSERPKKFFGCSFKVKLLYFIIVSVGKQIYVLPLLHWPIKMRPNSSWEKSVFLRNSKSIQRG